MLEYLGKHMRRYSQKVLIQAMILCQKREWFFANVHVLSQRNFKINYFQEVFLKCLYQHEIFQRNRYLFLTNLGIAGEGRDHLCSSLPLPLAHEHLGNFLKVCTRDGYFHF